MSVAKRIVTILFVLLPGSIVFPQSYIHPNVGLKSHKTLEILKIESTPENTTIFFSIENRIAGGAFCADRNIYIIYPDGTRLPVVSSKGIPRCPDSYKFKKIGEKLNFTLTFPALQPGTGWIDIKEDCSDNCFSFYGVLLNNALNARIDEAVSLVDKGEVDTAIGLYKSIIETAEPTGNGITGSLYADLISLLVNKGYTAMAKDYYNRLVNSSVPAKQLYVQNLGSRGIKF
ncbi:MAG TPA: hypothetical protein VJ954_01780 [Ignavibacteriaceae bacterium]|nr:hypothetical protein [Ignavibacteriaceae bacterium]